MEDGLFPSIRPFDDEDIEEERRLFYVGLTRAHERVFLSYAKMRRKFGSEPMPSIKSRFLMELPEDLIENKKEKHTKHNAGLYFFIKTKTEIIAIRRPHANDARKRQNAVKM